MSETIKRWFVNGNVSENIDGAYVLYSDFTQLKSERDELEIELKGAEQSRDKYMRKYYHLFDYTNVQWAQCAKCENDKVKSDVCLFCKEQGE